MKVGFHSEIACGCALVVCLALLTCCNRPRVFDGDAREQVRIAATSTLNAYHADICKRGLLAEFAYLDSSSDFHWQPPGSEGDLEFDSVAKAIRENAPKLTETCGEWKRLRVDPIAWDTARYEGILTIKSRLVTGDSMSQQLKENGVMVKRAGGWKLLSGKTTVLE